jgi:hypothetical protein
MFFLGLGKVALFARISLLVLICALVYLDISNFFIKLALLFAIAVALALSVIKAPADKDVMRQIEYFRRKFKERIQDIGHTYSMKNVKVLEAYRVKGGMNAKRVVGRDVIYPYLMSVAVAPAEKGTVMMYTDELCLLKKGEPEFREHRIELCNIDISTQVDDSDSGVVCIELKIPSYDEKVKLIVKNDFHYREFMETLAG